MIPQRHYCLLHLGLRILLLIIVTLCSRPSSCRAGLITWTNTAGGDWTVASNWSPNQVPGAGDSASITNPGTYSVTLITNGTVADLVLGGAGSGTQTFQANGFALTSGSISINSGGVLALTNETLNGALTVGSGGLLSCFGATLKAAVAIQSGGKFLLLGSSIIGESASSANTNDWLWVQSGGELDAAAHTTLYLYTPITNAGLANFTNSGLTFYNNGTSGYNGAVWNQPSGVLNFNLINFNAVAISGSLGADYLVNEGIINVSNYNSTIISVTSLTNLGTVALLRGGDYGTLRIGTFNGPGSLSGTYDAAAGATIQFVAGTAPGISAGTPLVLAGAGQHQFISGTLMLPTDVIPDLAMTGGILVLGPGFQGGAITNLTLSGITVTNELPIVGNLSMTRGTLYGALDVAAGATLSCNGSTLNGRVTIQSGGKFQVYGSTTVLGYPLWVQSGGELDAASNATLHLDVPMTNTGFANFTNSSIIAISGGALLNAPGGVLNFISGSGMSGNSLFNAGTINITNGNSTIDVTSISNQGTVVTMPGTGTLRIGNFNGLASLTGTYNAAAGTSIQFVGSSYPGTSLGIPLLMGGAGQYQFVSGTLTLPTDIIPGLALTGGTLLLGPGFQGGAITNLALSGISLTNSLPISGTLAMTNATLVTTSTLTNMGVLSLNGMTMYGRVDVVAGGLLSCSSATLLGGQVSVQSGGKLLLFGPTTIGQGGLDANINDWLTIQSGGELDAADIAELYLYTAMTNAGVANFTNYGMTIYNVGTRGYNGQVWNQPGGVLNLFSTAGISDGGFGTDYLVNEGTLNCLSPNAASIINVNTFTNAGHLNALYGTLRLQPAHLVLQPAGTLGVGLSSASVYGVIDIPGNAPLAGALGVTLSDGFVPQTGASFNIVTYGSFIGAFNNTNFQCIAAAPTLPGLQHTVFWGTTYSNTFMTITAQQLSKQFVFAGTNGPPGHQYVVLSSTDLALPRAAWIPVATNSFDSNGSFIFTTNIDPSRQQFFTYRYQ